LIKDLGKQEQLSQNIKLLARPNATVQIVDEIVKLIK
jgi:UDP-N-acetylglucosamine--N-acetylmuramyl-(pentapeptide) pyrophosphoryl-undecaprenol N-acetylglucosamine transferase